MIKAEYRDDKGKWTEISVMRNTDKNVVAKIAFEYSKSSGLSTRVVDYSDSNNVKVLNEYKRSK